MRISIGNDHRGVDMKRRIVQQLELLGHDVTDRGATTENSVDYPDIALAVGHDVAGGKADRGILICGTGIGMAVAANKVPGVRAATCQDTQTARLSRQHNDLNVLCLAGSLDDATTDQVVSVWLTTDFEGGRHGRRVQKIRDAECQDHESA